MQQRCRRQEDLLWSSRLALRCVAILPRPSAGSVLLQCQLQHSMPCTQTCISQTRISHSRVMDLAQLPAAVSAGRRLYNDEKCSAALPCQLRDLSTTSGLLVASVVRHITFYGSLADSVRCNNSHTRCVHGRFLAPSRSKRLRNCRQLAPSIGLD